MTTQSLFVGSLSLPYILTNKLVFKHKHLYIWREREICSLKVRHLVSKYSSVKGYTAVVSEFSNNSNWAKFTDVLRDLFIYPR